MSWQFLFLCIIFNRGAIDFDDVAHAGVEKDRQNLSEIEQKVQMDDPVNIQFTSGTTGNPKFILSQ